MDLGGSEWMWVDLRREEGGRRREVGGRYDNREENIDYS